MARAGSHCVANAGLEFINGMNARFDLDHQRKSDTADVQISDEEGADVPRFVDRSVLPLMLREARAAGLTLCFVRVQRRPIGGRPPAQSPAMRRYIHEPRRSWNRTAPSFTMTRATRR